MDVIYVFSQKHN